MPMSSTDFARLIKETWKGQICIREATQILAYRFQCWQGYLGFHSLSAWITANSADFSSLLFPLVHFLKFQEILQAKILLERVAWTQRSNWILCNHHRPAKRGQRWDLMSILQRHQKNAWSKRYIPITWENAETDRRKPENICQLYISPMLLVIRNLINLHVCFLQIS